MSVPKIGPDGLNRHEFEYARLIRGGKIFEGTVNYSHVASGFVFSNRDPDANGNSNISLKNGDVIFIADSQIPGSLKRYSVCLA